MRREATATAATIDEAISAAREQLGITEDIEVDIEIIDQPEKKVLGLFGGKPAKVTVSYDDGKKEKQERPKKAPKAEKKPAAPKAEKKPVKKEREIKKVELNEVALERTVNYVKAIVAGMKVGEITVSVSDVDGGFCLTLEGEGMGAVIGRRGETLDAIQYLASLCYNQDEDGFVRVVLDTNNYRAKREETLTALAVRVAEQAAQSGHNQALEPMNPYERRIIHTAVQGVEGVTSWSISDSRGRRVLIGPADENGNPVDASQRPANRRGGRNDRDRRGDRPRNDRRGGGRSSRPAYTPSEPTREKRSDASDLPLFGRIDK